MQEVVEENYAGFKAAFAKQEQQFDALSEVQGSPMKSTDTRPSLKQIDSEQEPTG